MFKDKTFMYWFLTHYDRKYFTGFVERMNDRGMTTRWVHSPVSHGERVNNFIGAWRAVKVSKKGDTIIAWYDFQGILAWWICLLTFRDRNIVALNIRLKDKTTLVNRMAAFLYKYALRSSNMKATVSSLEYGEALKKRLGISRDFPLVRDINLYPGYCLPFKDNGRRIFCGGNQSRDWNRVMRVARLLPDYRFVVIMPGKEREEVADVPSNVRILCDVPYKTFMGYMHSSTFLLLPVDTNAPAGLIVMFEATWLGKLLFTNSTQVMREYIGEHHGVLVRNDDQKFANKIEYYYNHQEEAAEKVNCFQKYLREECSEEGFTDRVIEGVLCSKNL